MFGLCMPTGSTYLLYNNGKMETIILSDESDPKKFIYNNKYVLGAVKRVGYKNIKAIIYESSRRGKKTIVTMADYYAENGLIIKKLKNYHFRG